MSTRLIDAMVFQLSGDRKKAEAGGLPPNKALQLPANSALQSMFGSLLASTLGASATSAALLSAAERRSVGRQQLWWR
jgi:hypothetical protein